MRVLGGGMINCYVTEEGRDYATDGFLSWGGYEKARTAAVLDAEDLNFKSDSDCVKMPFIIIRHLTISRT